MGSKLVSDLFSSDGSESETNGSASVFSYTEQFYEHLPFYLSIGMTYDQYWNEDCCLVKYYRKAYELKRERKNEQLWLQGMYIYEALCDVSPILHAFAKKGTKPVPYPSEPYAITEKRVKEKEEAKKKAEFEKAKSRMESFALAFNARFKTKNEEVTTDG